jgi:hypothetical protein
VHHQGRRARRARGARERAGIVDAAPDAGNQRHAAADLFRRRLHHGLGFSGGEPVELAGVAVDDKNMHSRLDRAVDDRREPRRRDAVLPVERRHQDAGNAGQRFAQLGIDGHACLQS